ncbi:MAG: T9SS type A sorting domain-containing protein [Flavobacteriales bacterium]|nr:T9SS type A sorting domain-containing protein [Flavobacteriales bacterium]MBP9081051.1 T9SS type A sorting domain-containing protein [Flavobacteriales bacterium]
MKLAYTVRSLVLTSLLCAVGTAQGQKVVPCATDEIQQRLIEANPDLLRQNAEYEHGLQAYLQAKAGQREDDTTVYIIPVVFHVLLDPSSTTDGHNVSDDLIHDQMERLNEDFRLANGTAGIVDPFIPIAGNMRIQFQLATKDPFGNCTNGIDRITSLRSTQAADFSKLNPWFREHYVNIWVIKALEQNNPGSTTLAYSQLPAFVQDPFGALRDGVIMLSSEVSGNSTTLTHELGHFLNLMHVWGGDNQPGVACGDDGVDDTPRTKGHFSFCDLNDHDCNNWPMGEAYTFDDVTPTSGTTDPTAPPAGEYQDSLPGLTYSAFTAAGLSANSAENDRFAFTQWDGGSVDGDSLYSQLTGSINTGKYYQFTVQPEFGRSMTITGLNFHVARSTTGPRTFAVRSSAGNYSSNLAANINSTDSMVSVQSGNVFFFKADSALTSPGNIISVSGVPYSHTRQGVTFRIYAWNAEDGDGSFAIDSVKLTGSFGAVDNAQNIMDYSNCNTQMFTWGQGDRMRATLNSSVSGRSNLWADANQAYAGINGNEMTCAPVADFYTLTPFVCPGVSVQFKANTKRATATSWQWTFEGGNPATSSLQNPFVTFDTPGPRNVTLTVANDQGSNTLSKWDAVVIGANYSEAGDPLQEGFNNQNDFNRWPNRNLENNQSYWHWTNETGHNAPGCAKLNASQTYTLVQDAFFPNNFSDIDNLYTPSLGLKFNQNMSVSFWYAYSTQTGNGADITEALRVYASSNCGESWTERLELDAADLVTAGLRSAGYVPAANEWRQATFTLSSLYASDKTRLKFEFRTGLFSNDLFIDDVNITSTNVGIDENAHSGALGLVPNPATNSVDVLVDLAGAASGTLSFLDLTGRLVHSAPVEAGTGRVHFDLQQLGLTTGVYLVRLQHANGQRTERLVVR